MIRVKVFLLTVVLAATAAVAQGWTVEPGKGVGPLALHMSPTQMAAQLAPTEYIGSQQNPLYVRYGGEDVLVQYASNKAVMITLNKPTVKTKAGAMKWTPYGGAGIGVAWNGVEQTLGRNYVSRDLKVAKSQPREVYYAYSSKGLGFRTRAGIIVQVDVWPAK
jgi:hypothetical protein